jgi:hypothetical protein
VQVYFPDFPAAYLGRLSLIIAPPKVAAKTHVARGRIPSGCQLVIPRTEALREHSAIGRHENLKVACALYIAHYNPAQVIRDCAWPRQWLPAHRIVTPAMEVGIADHVWSIEELVSSLDRSAKIHA